MIKLTNKVSIPTIDNIGLFDIIMRIDNFRIVEMVRFIDPNTPETQAINTQINALDSQLAAMQVTTSATNFNQRLQITQQRDALRATLQPLLIAEYGAAIADLRYYATDGVQEIQLPVVGLTESFECFVADLETYEGEDPQMLIRMKKKMRNFIITKLIESKFMGYESQSDYQAID